MKKIAIFNEKGGVGKTTSTINIAGCLAQLGKKVLILDCDQQCSLSSFFGYTPEEEEHTMYNVLMMPTYDIKESIRETQFKNLYLIPGSELLEEAPLLIQSSTKIKPFSRLQRQLEKIEDYFDYCLIDCAPGSNVITTNILKTSDELLAPVQLEELSLKGINKLAKTLMTIRENYNEDLIIRGIFGTRVNVSYSGHRDNLESLKNKFGEVFLPYYIRTDQKVNDAAAEDMPIVYYSQSSRATEDYFTLTREVILKNE